MVICRCQHKGPYQGCPFFSRGGAYLVRLGQELAPLQATHGGPIIAVQIENEYGTFGNDRLYMEEIHRSLVRAGFGDSILFTSDGAGKLAHDALPGILPVINFGQGKAQRSYTARFVDDAVSGIHVGDFHFDQPWMTGEYWAGWYDAWGGEHAQTDTALQAKEVDWMLGQGYSVNLYMFHGGTSFGFMNGANFGDGTYIPQVTSYDYDAALDEAGRPTRKFYLFRDVIQRRTGISPPPLPAPLPIDAIARFFAHRIGFALEQFASSGGDRASPFHGNLWPGLRLHSLPQATEWTGAGPLVIDDLRYYAAVYLNQKLQGTIDRRLKQTQLAITVPAGAVTLDILVENTGRVNYGPLLQEGQAGITRSVSLAGHELSGWQVYSLPMAGPGELKGWQTKAIPGPSISSRNVHDCNCRRYLS